MLIMLDILECIYLVDYSLILEWTIILHLSMWFDSTLSFTHVE